jgi:hypothetical protein
MIFAAFKEIVAGQPDGVVLLEGRRGISSADFERARCMGRFLALHFPRLRFRSGNAEGADQAFSEGVASADASRLQIVAPYASHRKSVRYKDATYDSPESLSQVSEEDVAFKTVATTPKNRGLIENRSKKGPFAAKAAYLIRDTMKVTGHSDVFTKPVCALFYVDLNDPMAGGTGHTIRVCRQEGVPHVFQDSWGQWAEAEESGCTICSVATR